MDSKQLIELSNKYIANTYNRFPIVLVRGSWCRVWDIDGKEYLDFVAGLAVCNLGHCHPRVVEAIQEQAEKLIHVSNLYHIEPQARLAELLCKNSFANKVFFCNSGAEANEAAIKLARKYFKDKSENRFQIITMEKSFHGRTMATLAATGQKKFQQGFEPLLEKFIYVPFNDVQAVESAITQETCAVMVEPIQGEGGVNIPSTHYLKDLKALCKDKGILLIFDEVQVGMGRTGKLFAYENYNVSPDIMTLAKGLAGGVAIGAMLATDEIAKSFTPGTHASTFGGNPLATAAGIAALKAVLEEGMLENCQKVGQYLFEKLNGLKAEYPFIKEVRGKGLIIGMELTIPGASIVNACMGNGLLINCTSDTILRFIPPLVVTKDEVDEMLEILMPILDGVQS
ncbi:MAG: acetylornithine aminotransferase [Deltaproteobacteria bacterium GWC2_42_11]|nr:MAG: acetylornithine aminotransferase [Deltaproteobacteria bacterium GWC2_42_11]HBO84267.1 acetylornithine transaminase [Deltaproteobacteria bacterium]